MRGGCGGRYRWSGMSSTVPARNRLPKERSKRDALAVQIGADGYALMDAIYSRDDAQHLRCLPDLEVLRCIWIQQYYRGSDRLEDRWRQHNESPVSPADSVAL